MKNTRFLFSLVAALSIGFAVAQSSIQPHTICIKHPAADNANAFFSGSTMYQFEVYKVGSSADIAKVIAAFQKDAAVESITVGALTGDYQAFTLTLKSKKTKSWFVGTFKQAGLPAIRLNRLEIVAVDKM
jgi:hypothetical protein